MEPNWLSRFKQCSGGPMGWAELWWAVTLCWVEHILASAKAKARKARPVELKEPRGKLPSYFLTELEAKPVSSKHLLVNDWSPRFHIFQRLCKELRSVRNDESLQTHNFLGSPTCHAPLNFKYFLAQNDSKNSFKENKIQAKPWHNAICIIIRKTMQGEYFPLGLIME